MEFNSWMWSEKSGRAPYQYNWACPKPYFPEAHQRLARVKETGVDFSKTIQPVIKHTSKETLKQEDQYSELL